MNSRKWPKRTTIELLPEDFENTYFTTVYDCPAARATKRKFKKIYHVLVTINTIDIYENGKYVTYYIEGEFKCDDYNEVRDYYKKHGAKKYIYYLKLTLVS